MSFQLAQSDIDAIAASHFTVYNGTDASGELWVAGVTVADSGDLFLKADPGFVFIENYGNLTLVNPAGGSYGFTVVAPIGGGDVSEYTVNYEEPDRGYFTSLDVIPEGIKAGGVVVEPVAWVTQPPAKSIQGNAIPLAWEKGQADYHIEIKTKAGAPVIDIRQPGTSYNYVNNTAGDLVVTITGADGSSVTANFTVAAKLVWVQHPTEGNINQDVIFSWDGGEPSVNGSQYEIVVLESDGVTEVDNETTANKQYTLNHGNAGNYTVNVYDKGRHDTTSQNITQAVELKTPSLPATGDYNFTTADYNKMRAAHVNMTVNGIPVTKACGIMVGDKLVATCETGYHFFVGGVGNTASINFSYYATGRTQYTPFTLESTNEIGRLTAPTTIKGVQATFNVATQSTPIDPLTWVNAPDTAEAGRQVRFEWNGGQMPTGGFIVKTYRPSGDILDDNTTTNHYFDVLPLLDELGKYKITVADSVTTIEHEFEVKAATPSEDLAWILHPQNAYAGQDYIFSWTKGNKPIQGYRVVIKQGNATISDTRTQGTQINFNQTTLGGYTVEVSDQSDTLTQAVTVTAVPVWDYVLKQDDYNRMRQQHVNMVVDGRAITGETGWMYGAEITCTTEPGYIFILNASGVHCYFTSPFLNYQFALNSGRTVATYKFEQPSDPAVGYLDFVCDTDQVDNVLGTNNIYLVDNDIMSRVAGARFGQFYDSEGSVTGEIDYGQYILGLIQLPFVIDSKYLMSPDEIVLGPANTGVRATGVNTDLIAVPMGEIDVPKVFDSVLDYVDTTAILHLPRCPSIALDLEFVIGAKLTVYYVVDLYKGKATVIVNSDKSVENIVQKEVDLGIKVPYVNLATAHAENDNIDMGGENGVLIPTVEIIRGDIALPSSQFIIPVKDSDKLVNHKGYIEVDQIELVCDALKEEKDEIMSFLGHGVIIK